MKFKLFISVLALLAIIGGIVYAQNSQDTFSLPVQFEFTEEQKAELNSIWEQMQNLRTQMIDKMVEFGAISPDRAQWMKDGWRLQQEERGELGVGHGPCCGPRPGRMHHRRMMGSWGW